MRRGAWLAAAAVLVVLFVEVLPKTLAIARTAESLLTVVAYAYLGLFSATTASLLGWVAPSVLVGMPLGHWLIRRIDPETFRRVCMSFDAWVVAFGLSRLLEGPLALLLPGAAVAIDAAEPVREETLARFAEAFQVSGLRPSQATASCSAGFPRRLKRSCRRRLFLIGSPAGSFPTRLAC